MKELIAFVDDEPNILRSLGRALLDDSYEVALFDDPLRALEELEKSPPQVVVSDQEMPRMKGVEFLEAVRERWPEATRIILTAHHDFHAAMKAINNGQVFRFLCKPWDNGELKQTLHNALEYHLLQVENRKLMNLLRRKNDKLKDCTARIRVLSGMLPICSCCKKIRDDKGYWQQIEAYIRRHSEADFTHGICPECAKKLYPDLFASLEKRKIGKLRA